MGERKKDSKAIYTENASITEFLQQNSETHQSHDTRVSIPLYAQGGLKRLETFQNAAKGKRRCDGLTGSPPPSLDISPRSEATYDYDGFDPTKSAMHMNAFSPDTSDQVSRAIPNHEDNTTSSSFIGSTTTASSRLSRSAEGSAVGAYSQTLEDTPKYSMGEMKIYDQKQKIIPKLYEARWHVIRPDIFDRVHKRLRRGRFAVTLNKQQSFPTIELMSAGVTKASSMPAVLVMIPRHIKRMQDFLNKDSTVQTRCRPEDGTTVELLALACKGSSTLIGLPNDTFRNSPQTQSDSSESNILSDSNDSLSSAEDSDTSPGRHSLNASKAPEIDPQSVSVVYDPIDIAAGVRHGMSILLIKKDGSQYVRGTCGGLLRLEAPNQPPRQVGLMAAHLLEQLGQDSMDQDEITVGNSPIIGNMVHPKNSGTLPLYDWALFDATKLGFDHDTTSFTTAKESEFPGEGTVVVIRTLRGDLAGNLSSSSSGIMLNAEHGFIQVRTIVMDEGSIITKGDSGAWVLGDGCVYGYIIATNGDDHAYMVPMHTAITEIQNDLSATVVSLAISAFPRPPVRVGTTHEHARQTERSVIFSDNDSVRLPHRGPRTIRPENSSTISSEEATPANSVATLQEQLPQVEQSQLELQRAEDFLGQGRIVDAIKILESVVQTRENILGPNHMDCIHSKYKLAVAYTQRGQTTDSIRILKHLVEEELVALEKSDLRRLTYQHELGRAHLADGEISEAIRVLEDVVTVKISTLDTSDRHLLASQVVLAEAYLRANRASVAVNLYEHILDVTSNPSSEHEQIRDAVVPWLNMARTQLDGSGSVGNLSGQPGLLFVHPKK